ncbi:4-hydroxybenzoate 3-monooxygenase [Arsenicicoccus sp. oral taxon 190]|uniref:4-hydroxybenzoate 3-monooxygenase n=1 Tax=Arsenicicoccus sp. oral taxon 190 TaxID=1658671 RepID=UPI00067A285C|nr:4-hydroxybenzoate 3-monooxygenase [Arsenicicoccus sp. oral taxon 190]AKT50973.1 4-hydroxybenzoate 3-monooxygenase [Arsenicicoccus sp. oral taxon 190]
MTTVTATPVAIVGAGPAGLMLSHRLAQRGIDSVAIDTRTRREIETTHRAGILEADSAQMLLDGVSDRILRDGYEHEGVELRLHGQGHRIDFRELVGASVWLYPQTDVFIDLADARERDGGTVHFGVTDVAVSGIESDSPVVGFTDADGQRHELRAQVVVGSDGSRSQCRKLVPEARRRIYGKEYPFAWFGILCEAPMSAPELIYAQSSRGFALISQRTESLQRMYLQCDPDEDVDAWSEDQIWSELQARVAGDGFELRTGPIVERARLNFRSFVQEPMSHGRLVLAGDAAHTVPPTGAKGLNLALADVKVLAEVLEQAFGTGDLAVLDTYGPRALARVWRAQNFSYWMTQMLHTPPGADAFDVRRQMGELETVTSTVQGRAYVAECYTGWPSHPVAG